MSRPIRSFIEMLGFLSRGKFVDKLNEHMVSAIETLEALPQEKGSATITVTITFNYEGGRLDLVPKVQSKLPDGKGFSGTPFWAIEGALSLEHPSQADMFPARDVSARGDRDHA
jgi:hypothetical protein